MSDTTKYVAIGDIHGCSRTLKALLKHLEIYRDRIYVFVGDYIDRGPDSKDVVDQLIRFSSEYQCIMLQGNHEFMMLQALFHNDYANWERNGGGATIHSYLDEAGEAFIPEEHLSFYQKTQLFYDTPDYFFVHAGLDPDMTIADSIVDPEQMERFIWERDHLYRNVNRWEKTVVFGHTPRPEPIIGRNMIGIDTGCVFSQRRGLGKLTAVLLPEVTFIQQESLENK